VARYVSGDGSPAFSHATTHDTTADGQTFGFYEAVIYAFQSCGIQLSSTSLRVAPAASHTVSPFTCVGHSPGGSHGQQFLFRMQEGAGPPHLHPPQVLFRQPS
jgi:hypothetical protein